MIYESKFQLGKAGLTEGVINSLILALKNYKQVRISVLKSSGRDRNSIEDIAKEMVSSLSKITNRTFSYKIIGFTIILRRYSILKTDKSY